MSICGTALAMQSIGSITLKTKKQLFFHPIRYRRIPPLIAEEIIEETISFAKSLINTDSQKIRTIKHCRKSLLFHNNVAWKTKPTTSCFDVTMGIHDDAEVCKLAGKFILSKL